MFAKSIKTLKTVTPFPLILSGPVRRSEGPGGRHGGHAERGWRDQQDDAGGRPGDQQGCAELHSAQQRHFCL